jgi:hypothetical protein
MLIDTSRHFIQALEQKTALVPLYSKQSLIVEVSGNDEVFWLSISPEGHRVLTEAPPEKATLFLSGSNDQVIEQAIKGEHPLLTMKERGDLDLKGPFNQQLTLESLLLLSSEQSYLII